LNEPFTVAPSVNTVARDDFRAFNLARPPGSDGWAIRSGIDTAPSRSAGLDVASGHLIEPSRSSYPPDRKPLGTAGQLFAKILGEEMAEPGSPVASQDHRAAPSRSCEPKHLVGHRTLSDWTTESYV
jgi:hypothetical protein